MLAKKPQCHLVFSFRGHGMEVILAGRCFLSIYLFSFGSGVQFLETKKDIVYGKIYVGQNLKCVIFKFLSLISNISAYSVS